MGGGRSAVRRPLLGSDARPRGPRTPLTCLRCVFANRRVGGRQETAERAEACTIAWRAAMHDCMTA